MLIMFIYGLQEYLPLIVALIRSSKLSQHKEAPSVYNFVTAAGEVGSGTPNAAAGKHFSALSPTGLSQTNNGDLAGLGPTWVKLVQYKPRGKDGSAKFDEDAIVADIRSKLTDEGNAVSVVVLHVVLGSKTGLVYPSFSTIESLLAEFGSRVVVVVDACQLRCRLERVREYSDAGYLSLVTGSKFYAGPPFR